MNGFIMLELELLLMLQKVLSNKKGNRTPPFTLLLACSSAFFLNIYVTTTLLNFEFKSQVLCLILNQN